jgi:hypothetical protein
LARYRLRQLDGDLTEQDLVAIDALYARSRGKHLPQPDMQDICDAALQGRLFVIARLDREHEICGIAGLFPIADCAFQSDENKHKVYELAGMVLDRELCGFGLQQLLIALRLMTLARGESTNVCVVSSVDAANVRSAENLKSCGLAVCDSPSWMRSIHRSWCDNESEVVDLIATPDTLAAQAAYLLKLDGNWTRKNRGTGEIEEISLHLDVRWLKDRSLLAALAERDSVEWDRTIPSERLLSVGEAWVRIQSRESREALATVAAEGKAPAQASAE